MIATLKKLLTHFSHSGMSTDSLDDKRAESNVGQGLVAIGTTRFATVTWAALSVQRSLDLIYDLVADGSLVLPVSCDLHVAFSVIVLHIKNGT